MRHRVIAVTAPAETTGALILKIPAGLLNATRLVRAGNLIAATEAIQRALRGRTPASPPGETEPIEPAAGAIEGSFSVVEEPPTADPGVTGDKRPHRAAPDAGKFLTRAFTNAAGTREYKLYVPSQYDGQAMPLVVMLHGCKQDPADFAAGTRMNQIAEQEGFFVAYPGQTRNANGSNCWNWFELKDQQRDAGEPSIIAGITRAVVSEYGLDARRVYAGGLSAGGAMAVIMGTTYPDVYAAVGIHSGLAYASAHDVASAFAAMRGEKARRAKRKSRREAPERTVPTIVFHGDSDTTVHPSNGEELLAQASAASRGGASEHAASRYARAVERGNAAGRTYTRTIYRDSTDKPLMEHWVVHGAAHAWSGGSSDGSFTDRQGPDASREMVRFFLQHQTG